jgi:hypothetical protein
MHSRRARIVTLWFGTSEYIPGCLESGKSSDDVIYVSSWYVAQLSGGTAFGVVGRDWASAMEGVHLPLLLIFTPPLPHSRV